MRRVFWYTIKRLLRLISFRKRSPKILLRIMINLLWFLLGLCQKSLLPNGNASYRPPFLTEAPPSDFDLVIGRLCVLSRGKSCIFLASDILRVVWVKDKFRGDAKEIGKSQLSGSLMISTLRSTQPSWNHLKLTQITNGSR